MSLSVEYRGYTIRYSENEDVWNSDAFEYSKYSAPTLSKAKERIDSMLRDVRKKAALTCYRIDGGHQEPYRLRECTVIEYNGPKVERPWQSSKKPFISSQNVGVVSARDGRKAARSEMCLENLIHGTAEDQVKIDTANRFRAEARRLEEEAKTLLASIPRVSLDDIQELVRISGVDPTGGLKE